MQGIQTESSGDRANWTANNRASLLARTNESIRESMRKGVQNMTSIVKRRSVGWKGGRSCA